LWGKKGLAQCAGSEEKKRGSKKMGETQRECKRKKEGKRNRGCVPTKQSRALMWCKREKGREGGTYERAELREKKGSGRAVFATELDRKRTCHFTVWGGGKREGVQGGGGGLRIQKRYKQKWSNKSFVQKDDHDVKSVPTLNTEKKRERGAGYEGTTKLS